ncbi:MAG: ATP-binding protein [Spirochaetes bacterium]|nr:ATP-binding protein [Spirochaetota bacterium]
MTSLIIYIKCYSSFRICTLQYVIKFKSVKDNLDGKRPLNNGILNLFLFSPETILLENIVFTELLRRHGNDFYYYKNKTDVGFFIKETKSLIQVRYSLGDPDTRNREVTALKKAHEYLDVDEMLLLTLDNDEIIDENITVIPVWRWLLEK